MHSLDEALLSDVLAALGGEVTVCTGLATCGSPLGSIVSGGKPGGGGRIPPGIISTVGTTMMPIPGPTYHMGSTVTWPSTEVVVAEFAVRPEICAVVVKGNPGGIVVCNPGVIGMVEMLVGSFEEDRERTDGEVLIMDRVDRASVSRGISGDAVGSG